MNLSTDADSRTDTIFEWLCDFSQFFFVEKSHVTSQKKKKNLKKKERKKEKNHATSQKLCRSYYPHRSRDSLSPVCRIFFFTVYHRLPFSPVFFTVFHPFSPFSTAFHWFSKKFTIYHCFFFFFSSFFFTIFNRFFTIFNRFFSLTIFNRFPPFCIGTTICKRREIQCLPYAGFCWQDFSFGDISLLVTFQF